MTIPEILKELEIYNGRLPRAAMEAAIAQQEAITPELLRVVETVAENPAAYEEREDYVLPLFALYLLAQFREKRAFVPIIKMVSAPGETVDVLLADAVTGGLNRILASVYDGDPAPLRRLVENEEADEFVRSAALDAFVVLANSGQVPRDEVADYFRRLFQGKLNRDYCFVWNALVSAVADLPAAELMAEVRWAYAHDLVDSTVATLTDIENDFANPEPWRRERLTVITDAIDELEDEVCFDPEVPWPRPLPPEPPKFEAPPPYVPPPYVALDPVKPIRREQPKIGRNDPCPCGSGKKYKKCCGRV